MPTSDQPQARFRSATEFPKTIDSLEPIEANALYSEMRECLIFTNRSRAQLIRWNDRHKQDKLELKVSVSRLQEMIQQLTTEKQQLSQDRQQIVSELEHEIRTMAINLDRLTDAFEPFADLETAEQSRWSVLSLPGRFFKFLQAVKSIVMWWKEEKGDDATLQVTSRESPQIVGETEAGEDDRRDRPWMYDDQASQGRSLLDK
ncbi:MAG: hypothetical protein VKK04_05060 [Synechococcales bacterium]|nr:hypothetical protein [Synechococcales bacterium]